MRGTCISFPAVAVLLLELPSIEEEAEAEAEAEEEEEEAAGVDAPELGVVRVLARFVSFIGVLRCCVCFAPTHTTNAQL